MLPLNKDKGRLKVGCTAVEFNHWIKLTSICVKLGGDKTDVVPQSRWSVCWDGAHVGQQARKPPSTGRVTPLIMLLFSLSRNKILFTTSSTSARKHTDGSVRLNMLYIYIYTLQHCRQFMLILTTGFEINLIAPFGCMSESWLLMKTMNRAADSLGGVLHRPRACRTADNVNRALAPRIGGHNEPQVFLPYAWLKSFLSPLHL